MPTTTTTSGVRPYHRLRWRLVARTQQPTARHERLLGQIRQQRAQFRGATAAQLRETAAAQRARVQDGQSALSDAVLCTTLALVDEAMSRNRGMQFFDVQLLAGICLAHGTVIEMATGEGKTFVGSLAATLYALQGNGVHVVTTNSYLARRDFECMRPVYQALGLTVGCLLVGDSPHRKRAAYAADITYGTGYEFGFDYLRDRILLRQNEQQPLGARLRRRLNGSSEDAWREGLVQRGYHAAVVDEADSVLLDEALTPLLISHSWSTDEEAAPLYRIAEDTALQLEPHKHFHIDEAKRAVRLTATGVSEAHDALREFLNAQSPQALPLRRPWADYVEQSLAAKLLFRRDVDYVVNDDRILLVDQNTGRVFRDRSWQAGLHQAIENKERLQPRTEDEPAAQMTRQSYFGLYETLCGMTGTATGSERELRDIYRLPVVKIPEHRRCLRQRLATRFFRDLDSKLRAILRDVQTRHAVGQPVLLGTRTIQLSLEIAKRLERKHLLFHLLNGVQDHPENEVIARAGEVQAITVATNMAGRGTDIRLTPAARAAGGLHVIGVEHHVCSRVDRQLAGRAARQGDPGSAQFYACADDELIRIHSPALARTLREQADARGECHRNLAPHIRRLQNKCERAAFDQRQLLLHYDLD